MTGNIPQPVNYCPPAHGVGPDLSPCEKTQVTTSPENLLIRKER